MQMNSQINGSENNAASNHISANVANGSKAGENSDEESDAQVSTGHFLQVTTYLTNWYIMHVFNCLFASLLSRTMPVNRN